MFVSTDLIRVNYFKLENFHNGIFRCLLAFDDNL